MFIQNKLGLLESLETLLAHEQRLSQVTNNLANVDTAGYKKDGVTFWEMLYEASHNRQRVGKGLKILTSQDQGVVQETNNPFDLAISGKGFFKVQTPEGIRYTRAGNFHLNPQNQLANGDGHLVLGDGGPISILGSTFTVTDDGRLFSDGEPINSVSVVSFEDPSVLEKEGNSLYRPKDGTVQEQIPEGYQVKQGFLEKSNVNTITEMTEMIDLYRAFESQQKMIRTIDDIDDQAVRRVGSLAG